MDTQEVMQSQTIPLPERRCTGNASSVQIEAGSAAWVSHLLKVGAQGLDIDGLDLIVPCPNDFAAGVHGGHGLLAPDLDQHRAIVIAQAHTAALTSLVTPEGHCSHAACSCWPQHSGGEAYLVYVALNPFSSI